MNKNEFKKRRASLMQQIGSDNIALIASARRHIRNGDVEFPFRQDSDFYYLTGFSESDALAVFMPNRKQGEYILFCQEYDEKKALWEGAHAGLKGAIAQYDADDAFPIDDMHDILPRLLENKHKVFYPMGRDGGLDQQVLKWINDLRKQTRNGINAPHELVSIEHILHEMRLFKSESELKLMRSAATVCCQAHKRAMQRCKPGMYEYQIESEIVHEFMQQGLRAVAYPSIVAGGKNACVLHYVENRDKLKQGDLLLIDAGVEYDHYASDITRTFPVSGRFSTAQKQIYQLVLEAQYAALAQIKPKIPWNKAHDASVEVISKGLVQLGLLKGSIAKLIKEEKYKQFYMHKIGHWLGMDVHDVGDYKLDNKWRLLESGMVLTVEPGLYIPKNCTTVDASWRGIGIRIEDDVLVTPTGHEVLTQGLVKEVDEIEQLMRGS